MVVRQSHILQSVPPIFYKDTIHSYQNITDCVSYTLYLCGYFVTINLYFSIPSPFTLSPLTPHPLWQQSVCSLFLWVHLSFVCLYLFVCLYYNCFLDWTMWTDATEKTQHFCWKRCNNVNKEPWGESRVMGVCLVCSCWPWLLCHATRHRQARPKAGTLPALPNCMTNPIVYTEETLRHGKMHSFPNMLVRWIWGTKDDPAVEWV